MTDLAPPLNPPPQLALRTRILSYLALAAATVAAFAAGFALLHQAQFVHEALIIFGVPDAPSAIFLSKEIDTTDEGQKLRTSAQGRLGPKLEAQKADRKNLADNEDQLYAAQSAFKQAAMPYLVKLKDADFKSVQTRLTFDDLDKNHLLLLRHCAGSGQKDCVTGTLPTDLQPLWTAMLDRQRVRENTRRQLARDSEDVEDIRTELKAANDLLAGAAYNAPGKRTMMIQYQRMKPLCGLSLCPNRDSSLAGLLFCLTVAMGAAGGAVLAWLRIIGSDNPTPLIRIWWPIASGALASPMGYFIILFGATLFSGQSQTAPSPVDPRTVVALSLLLGLAGQEALEAFKSIGVAVRDAIPKLINRVMG